MSIVGELHAIAQSVSSYLKKRDRSDAKVFTELIDPVYLKLEGLVAGMLAMYRPVITGLQELKHRYQVESSSQNAASLADANILKLPSQDVGRELNAGPALESESDLSMELGSDSDVFLVSPIRGARINPIAELSDGDFRNKYAPAIREIVAGFTQSRSETRPARLQVDAAACTLIDYYETRTDDFASQVRQFAWQLRNLVGRAHLPVNRGAAREARSDLILSTLEEFHCINSQHPFRRTDGPNSEPLTDAVETCADDTFNYDALL